MIENVKETQKIKLPSNRSFGFTVGGILAAFVGYRWWYSQDLDDISLSILAVAFPLIVLATIYSKGLTIFNIAWMKLAVLLARVINPLIMLVIWCILMIPIGLALRIAGKDLLKLRLDPDKKSYWEKCDGTDQGVHTKSMKNQF